MSLSLSCPETELWWSKDCAACIRCLNRLTNQVILLPHSSRETLERMETHLTQVTAYKELDTREKLLADGFAALASPGTQSLLIQAWYLPTYLTLDLAA
jgi:hypothetical protein